MLAVLTLEYGLLVGLDLVGRATRTPAPELAHRVARRCLELGMMTEPVPLRASSICIAAILTTDEIDLALDIFDRAIRDSLG